MLKSSNAPWIDYDTEETALAVALSSVLDEWTRLQANKRWVKPEIYEELMEGFALRSEAILEQISQIPLPSTWAIIIKP